MGRRAVFLFSSIFSKLAASFSVTFTGGFDLSTRKQIRQTASFKFTLIKKQ